MIRLINTYHDLVRALQNFLATYTHSCPMVILKKKAGVTGVEICTGRWAKEATENGDGSRPAGPNRPPFPFLPLAVFFPFLEPAPAQKCARASHGRLSRADRFNYFPSTLSATNDCYQEPINHLMGSCCMLSYSCQFATFTFPLMRFVFLSKVCISIVFNFSWD